MPAATDAADPALQQSNTKGQCGHDVDGAVRRGVAIPSSIGPERSDMRVWNQS